MPTPQQLMASVPYDQRTGGSPAGDAIRNLIQQDAIQKRQSSLKFQGQVAQENASATQPFPDEQTPDSLMQQVKQMQYPQQLQQGAPGQQPQSPPQLPAPGSQDHTNPQAGPVNPGAGPVPEPTHTGGAKFQKGRVYR
jgi:hypothetical protein